MKLKNILGVCVAATTLVVGGSNVFAADTNTITYGVPIDLETGSAVGDVIAEGTKIAIPIDVTTQTGKMTSFGMKSAYNTEYITPGFADAEISDTQYNNLIALGNNADSCIERSSDALTDLLVKNVFTIVRGNKVIQGNYVVTPDADGTNHFNAGWYVSTATNYAPSADEPEMYLLCTVKKEVTEDVLNTELLSPVISNMDDSISDASFNDENVVPDATKLNATQGAFKVVLDSAALPNGNWVQGLYAQVGDTKQDITACVHADGTTTYEFPVRVNSATGATDSITADIYANVTADEAGNTTVSAKKVGSVTLTMDGTVTSYNVVNGTVAE